MSHRPAVLVSCVLLVALACQAAVARERSRPRIQKPQVERVVVVDVPVQVDRRGEPVRGLTAENFEIYDRGRPQRITGFSVADLTVSAPAEPESRLVPRVAISARRHFLVLFDVDVRDSGSLSRARSAVREWAADSLHPWDLVAVAKYSSRNGVKLLLNFTSDREQVTRAVEALARPERAEARFTDPLGLEIGVASQPFVEGAGLDTADTGGMGTRDSSTTDEGQEALSLLYHSAYEPLQRHGERHRVTEFANSFASLARMMRDVRGRKFVVFLSEGFDASLVFASDDSDDVQRMNRAAESGQIWTIDSSKRFGSAGAQVELSDMIEEFRRSDCVIQAIEVGGDRRPGDNQSLSSRGTDGLFFLAHETGGELFRNYNNLDDAMSNLMRKTSVTYLLAFQPDDIAFDGKYHRLKVKLKDAPKGARLTHRPGYFAPGEQREPDARQRWFQAAASIMEGLDRGDFPLAVLSAPFPAPEPERAYVPVLVEIDGAGLPSLDDRARLELELYAYAIREDGAIGGFFSERIAVDLGPLRDALRRQGLKFFGDLELPPGRYSLRVLVRDTASDATALRAVPLDVPDFAATTPSVLPPFFPEVRGKWLLVRESTSQAGANGQRFPFTFRDEPYLPAARPVLEASTRANMCLVAYHLGEGEVTVTAEALDADGKVRGRPRVELLELASGSKPGEDRFMAGVHAAGLDAGEYRLRVTVSNDRTGVALTSSIPMTVSGGKRVTDRP